MAGILGEGYPPPGILGGQQQPQMGILGGMANLARGLFNPAGFGMAMAPTAQAAAQGMAQPLMQAHQAMPWGGNDPSAIGIDTARGTMDPSVMVPFATNVAGMATTGALAAPPVAGAAGMGIRAYHGSPHDFDRPTMDFAKDRYLGKAIYLAPDPDDAAGYGRFLHQFDVDVENPAVIETSNLNFQISDDYAKQLRDAGHDAIVLRIIDRDLDTGEIVARYDKEIAIWDENKLKKLNMLDLESEGAQNTLDEWHGGWRKGRSE